MFWLKLISRLPLSVLYLFSDFLFFMGYRVIRYRRAIVRNNLKKSFPEKSDAERLRIERDFYHHLCDYPMETLKLMTMSEEEVKCRMKYTNPEVIEKWSRQGKAMMYLTSHQFNWEWMLAGVCLYTTAPVFYVYQKQSSRFFDDFSNLIRMRFGGHPIERRQVGREAIKRKGTLHALAMLADQFPGHSNDKRFWTNFLKQDTAFFQGINQLAIMTQYPVIFFISRKIKRGYYENELVTIGQPPYAAADFKIIEKYVTEIEKVIRERPENWLWSHDRWKRTRAEAGDV